MIVKKEVIKLFVSIFIKAIIIIIGWFLIQRIFEITPFDKIDFLINYWSIKVAVEAIYVVVIIGVILLKWPKSKD
jgi:hypothetical protein